MQKKNKESNKNNTNPFPKMEEEVLDFWDKAKTFEKSVENPPRPAGTPPKDGNIKDYVFYDGPPFGTGEPHYGHILSSVTKDVVPRYWTMRGYRVERRWGWDCHGLPIENIIEQDLKISGKKEIEKIGVAKFNEACRSRVLEYADIWEKMVRRIARWVEFKNSYKTMDLSYMESVWWAFKELWKKDLVYKGRKVLLYCPRCETPISNFEVAMDNSYQDITETSVYVKFKIANLSESKANIANTVGDGNMYILAWTTTPWTLPGNVALAVGKDIKYVVAKRYDSERDVDEYFVIAEEFYNNRMTKDLGDMAELRVGEAGTDLRYGKYELVKKFKGKDLVGLEYEPLFDVPALKNSGKKIYYVADADFVTTEDGTGVVHTAVVYGEDDYNLGLKLDLPVIPALDEKGYFNETVPQFKGVYFKKADKMVIADLEKRCLLFKTEQTTHPYPFCHRCNTQLFYNAIPAWFLNIGKIRDQLIIQNEKINWYPEHLKHGRFKQGLEQAPDWNISRNRYFATPMPIWECDKCEEREMIGSVKELEKKSGQKNIKDIHRHFIDDLSWKCSKCDGKMRRIKEVFDCWVESGSMSFAQMHYPFENKERFEKIFPAQFISEYISQTRAWFYVMHVMSTALFSSNSFENCVTNGVILTEKGEKMSKSKKNYPDPWKVINEFGVDSLRFYLMSSSLMHAENLFFNERDLRDIFRKNVMILWNVYKFYSMFAGKNEILSLRSASLQNDSINVLDKWILARLNELVEIVTEGMDNYDLPKATRPITEFIDDLSTWYIRRSRDRFKGSDEAEKKAALQTTGYVLQELSKLIAPFMPFMAEQIWQKVTGYDFKDEEKSVHLEGWSSKSRFKNEELRIIEEMEIIRKIVELGLAERDKAGIKVRQPLNELRIKNYELIIDYEDLIKDELNVKNILNIKGKGDIEVELDTELTPELKQEGMKREIVRFVNNLRKKAGLTIKDRVVVFWESKSKDIKEVFNKYGDDIKKDTLAEEIKEGIEKSVGNKEVMINGEGVVLGIKKYR
ncbi:MAG: isoleucine--tRNA ligase [Patescibacteria group bacterium]